MATVLGTSYFDNYANYQLAYDLLGQSTANNSSTVRLYGILNVTGNSVGWSRGSASVHTESQGIGTYYSRGSYTVIQRDFTFYHDNNGNFSSWIGASISTSYHSGSTGGTLTLPKINRYPILNSGSNFTDESNPVYNITAYGTYQLRVKIEAGNNPQFITRNLSSRNSQTYTLELTEEERNKLRALIPNNNSLKVRETVCAMSGSTELAVSYKDYTMTMVNANPVFSNFEYEDINPTTLALTGDNKTCINGYSNIKATIPVENKAEAIKSATMVKYKYVVGDMFTDMLYSDSQNLSAIIKNVANGTFTVHAIDSRNNATPVVKIAEKEIQYVPIYIDKQNSKIERDDNRVGDNAILTLNGTFWNDDFGDVVNSITSVTYKLKKTSDSTWITGTTTITPTVSQNTFTFSGMIASDNQDTTWDLDASYNVEVIIEDELSITTIDLILNSAVPTLSLDKEGVGIMCAYDSSIGGYLQINGTPIGNNEYLTTEQVVGTWLGKPLYRVVVVGTSPSSVGQWKTLYGNNIKDITKYGGHIVGSTTTNWAIPLNTNDTNIWFSVQSNEIKMAVDARGFTNKNIEIWFEYTKTTD